MDHFGGYADIRVLLALRSFNEGWGNAFLLFTAAWFSQSRHERSSDLSVSLISERPSCAGLRVDQPVSKV